MALGKITGSGPTQAVYSRNHLSAQLNTLGSFVHRKAPRGEAEDILQETALRWLSAGMPLDEQQGLPGSAAGFAWNIIRERQRRRPQTCLVGRELVLEGIHDRELAPEQALELAEALRGVYHAIGQLRLEHRQVIVWRCLQKRPMAEVAALMGKSVQATRSMLNRARAELLRRLRQRRR